MQGLVSAKAIGDWVSVELAKETPDVAFILRVVPHEINKWFSSKLTAGQLQSLLTDHPETGCDKWNALIEGNVLYRCQVAGIAAPEWTKRTRLSPAWNPKNELVDMPSLSRALTDVFSTPTPLLDKGVHFSRRSMLDIT